MATLSWSFGLPSRSVTWPLIRCADYPALLILWRSYYASLALPSDHLSLLPQSGLNPIALPNSSTSSSCLSPELHTHISKGHWDPTGTLSRPINSQFSLTPSLQTFYPLTPHPQKHPPPNSSFKPELWVIHFLSHLWEHNQSLSFPPLVSPSFPVTALSTYP